MTTALGRQCDEFKRPNDVLLLYELEKGVKHGYLSYLGSPYLGIRARSKVDPRLDAVTPSQTQYLQLFSYVMSDSRNPCGADFRENIKQFL